MSSSFKEEFYSRTYKYSLDTLKFVKSLPRDQIVDIVAKQLVRSVTSVAANILEARAASSKKDYINFYTHALKSANKSELWFSLIKDYLALRQGECPRLLSETIEIAKILGASILTMKGKRGAKNF